MQMYLYNENYVKVRTKKYNKNSLFLYKLILSFSDPAFALQLLDKFKNETEKQLVYTLDTFQEKVGIQIFVNGQLDTLWVNVEDAARAQNGTFAKIIYEWNKKYQSKAYIYFCQIFFSDEVFAQLLWEQQITGVEPSIDNNCATEPSEEEFNEFYLENEENSVEVTKSKQKTKKLNEDKGNQ